MRNPKRPVHEAVYHRPGSRPGLRPRGMQRCSEGSNSPNDGIHKEVQLDSRKLPVRELQLFLREHSAILVSAYRMLNPEEAIVLASVQHPGLVTGIKS